MEERVPGRDIPYWKDKTVAYHVEQELSQETIDHAIPSISNLGITIPPGTELFLNHGMGHVNVDYARVLNDGAESIIKQAEELRDKTDDQEKKDWYEGVIISFKAFIDFAHRYAALARELAEKEADEKRKAELYNIADICEWVPEHPARDFQEAVQAFWFT